MANTSTPQSEQREKSSAEAKRSAVNPAYIPLASEGPEGPEATQSKPGLVPQRSGALPRYFSGWIVTLAIGVFVVVPVLMGSPLLGVALGAALMLAILFVPWTRRRR